MLSFARDRILLSVCVLLTATFVGFLLLQASGDLAASLAGENASADDIAQLRQQLGLDQPLLLRYWHWLIGALQGDLGTSYFTREPVTGLFAERLGATLTLAIAALVISVVVSLPLGVFAALKPNSWVDGLLSLLALSGQAVPSFWLGLIFISFFGVTLRWLPISGSDTAMHFVLPSVVLAVSAIPALARLVRSGMIEVLSQDYIRTARSKGLPRHRVLMRHALRNALLPVISLTAVQLGALLGGSVIVEAVFAIDGIGQLTFRSIQRGDFPVVQAMLVFVALSYTVLTLVADLMNAWIDPRLRSRK
ncbi:ABC transporter permease [Pseudooceanicola marinus]|uniref:ABC transporter permease n=1 Tax=Pseudooceanicola marinus TaxID=396013 RepID=UPI001CD2648A|nr:ABC transporter permease [Pseudooceanicola marinus]MCA1337486.1 ABC transporter permease [Pseudooceanicola marinus]